MKIVNYRHEGREGVATVSGSGLAALPRRLAARWSCVDDVLRDDGLGALRDAGDEFEPTIALAEVELLPPVRQPAKILCVGLNYRSHIAEGGGSFPERPILFPRYPESLVGSGQPMRHPGLSEQYDFEGELAFVIGRPAYRVAAAEALAHVAGYACFNDGSVRDFQRHTSQWMPGKNFLRSGAFGPWLVTSDEVADPAALTLTTRLNGAEMQRAQTSDLLFGIPEIIEYVTSFLPLEPGDVVATGTTGGVGAARKPPVWMRPGDVVEVEISGVGTLTNAIVAD